MRERTVEARLSAEVKRRGGWAVKLLPSVTGLPDRMILLPSGRTFFVETKAPHGRLSAVQQVIHRRFASLGFPVATLFTIEQVIQWCQQLDQQG